MVTVDNPAPVPSSGTVVGTTSNPTTTSATYVVIPEMTLSITPKGSTVLLIFDGNFDVESGDTWKMSLFSGGAQLVRSELNIQFFGGSLLGLVPAAMQGSPFNMHALVTGLTPNVAVTLDARWVRSAGTARAVTVQRQLTAVEII